MSSENGGLAKLASALIAAQRDMPAIKADATNPHYRNRYTSLDHLLAEALPVLNRHGIAFIQLPSHNDLGAPTLTTTLLHESGEQMSASMLLFLPKQDPQGQGSALTYARRQALEAALGIGDQKDDDGEAAARDSGREPSGPPVPAADAQASSPPLSSASRPEDDEPQFVAPTPNTISEAQRRRMFTIASKLEVPQDVVRVFLRNLGGVESSKALPKARYDAVVAAIENWRPPDIDPDEIIA